MIFTQQLYEIYLITEVKMRYNVMIFTQQLDEIYLITGVKMCYIVMTFIQQVDEICLITGVKKYTNGIDFHRFQGGIFRPRGLHSDN